MTVKRQRELKSLVESVGLQVVKAQSTGGSHYKIRVRAEDGDEQNFIFSRTPSCNRADLNNRSVLRRWAAEHTGSTRT